MEPVSTRATGRRSMRACPTAASKTGAKIAERAVAKLRASKAGNTQRVTATATRSPVIEKRPSCTNPVKVENSIALKPQIETSTPSCKVGQMRGKVASGDVPGAVWVKR
jgi:hypothetical protein